MLFCLSSLGDLSRFRKVTHLRTTVLVLGDEKEGSVECSGLILAARSPVLEQHLSKSCHVTLDNCTGGMNLLQLCLDLLHGGRVSLNSNNVCFFLRFGIQFEIDELVKTCCVWMDENNISNGLKILKEPRTEKRLHLVLII